MNRRLVLIVTMTLLLGACGAGETEPVANSTPSSASASSSESKSPADPSGAGTVIKTASSEFGPMLFDQAGQAIYLFEKEQTSKPECYDACADAWPPVLTKGDPQGTGEVDPELLGTTERTDGTMQVTYAGHPLYFYAHEGKNEVLCHNVTGFGGLWLVVTPEGKAAPA